MSQVLSNLLSNAVSHGAAGTPVTVRAHADRDAVVFSVHNQGRPIAQEDLPHIFDPMRSSPGMARSSDHLGLGLYLAERVVTAHSGSLSVESTEPDGTTFTVTLPRARPASCRVGCLRT